MRITEKDIIHEHPSNTAWVLQTKNGYEVLRTGNVCSLVDSAYALTDDGKSIAIARCNYLGYKLGSKKCQTNA